MATNLTKPGGYIQSNANVQVIFMSSFYILPHLVLSSSQKHPHGRLLCVSTPIFNSGNIKTTTSRTPPTHHWSSMNIKTCIKLCEIFQKNDMKTNPLALLAATCSKIGPQPTASQQPTAGQQQQQPVVKLNAGQLALSSPASQLAGALQQAQQPGIVLNGQMFNGIQTGNIGNSLSYSLVQPQQLMTVNVQGLVGHDQTLFSQLPVAPVQQSAIQLGSDGSLPLILQNGQLTVSQHQPTATAAATAIAGNTNTHYLSIKQGDQVQQVPVIQQSPQLMTVPIQVPVAYCNGSPIFQTHHVPMQALQQVLQSSASGEQLLPQQNLVNIQSFLQNSVAPANDGLATSAEANEDANSSIDDSSSTVVIKPEPTTESDASSSATKSKRKVSEPRQVVQQQPDPLQQAILQADLQPPVPTPQTVVHNPELQFATNSIILTSSQPAPTLQGVQIVGGSTANLVQAGVAPAPIILQAINAQQVCCFLLEPLRSKGYGMSFHSSCDYTCTHVFYFVASQLDFGRARSWDKPAGNVQRKRYL